MPIQKIEITEFVSHSLHTPIIDVRSPGEFACAHIPGACSIPLFDDEERKIIGTLYKQQGRQEAIKKGLEFFGPKMRAIVDEAEKLCREFNDGHSKKLLIHCWRGGMRSGAIAWLLELYGFEVYQLTGGYKAFRNWVIWQFDKSYRFKILGGYTGSGKTKVLSALARTGHTVIDLEALANHKGSAFGALGEDPQPRQEMFENLLAVELHKKFSATESYTDQRFVWLEDESQRIGQNMIPLNIWNQMRNSPISFLDIEFEKRLGYLVEHYGKFDTEKLVNSIIRIKKRLGGLEAKNAIGFLLENDITESFRILLNYYDKLYSKGLHNRENLSELITTIGCTDVDAEKNMQQVLNIKSAEQWQTAKR